MTTLPDLIKRDSVTAAWFWVTSISAGPYAENEQFDATFVRETNMLVGGGYHERRTFHTQGTVTAQTQSRRENGGRIVRPDTAAVLAHVIADAHEVSEYTDFRTWAEEHRESASTHRDVLNDFEEYKTHRALHTRLMTWLGDEYDEYLKAAQEYAAEH